MALSKSTLATELAKMTPTTVEAEAIQAFAAAFDTYFKESTVLGIPAAPATLAPAKTAMTGAMSGMSTTAAPAIQAGIIAYWNAATAVAPTVWVTAPLVLAATPPPGLSGISAALVSVFTSNTSAKLDLESAAQAVADVLHPTQLGGIAAMTPPPPGVTAPIL